VKVKTSEQEESRKQFEAWFHSRYDQISMPPVERSMLFTNQWASWQASRATIEIELPSKQPCSQYEHYMPQFTMDADMVENAIRAAGLTVKGDSK